MSNWAIITYSWVALMFAIKVVFTVVAVILGGRDLFSMFAQLKAQEIDTTDDGRVVDNDNEYSN